MARRRVEVLISLLLVGGVVAAVVVAVLIVRGHRGPAPAAAPPATSAPATTTSKPPKDMRLPAALVVKVDNVSAARPHTGIGGADAIVIEPVEGGLTRILAVYWGERPQVVGPVRSARESDIELLAQFKRPVLAYSGSASQLEPSLRRADLVLASPDVGTPGFYRSATRPSPHNMYVNPNRLPETTPVESPLPFGEAPDGGKSVSSHRASYRSAKYGFTWSEQDERWRVSLNGSPLVSTERGRMTAATVVVQRVKIVRGLGIEDAAGSVSPVARTVGTGPAVVLRDGKAYQATWSRPSAKKPTTFTTSEGEPLPFAKGTAWVLLVPE